MQTRSRVVSALAVVVVMIAVANAWTVQQVQTWTQVTRTNGSIGFIWPNGYHLYSNSPEYDACLLAAETAEIACTRKCDLDHPECPGDCTAHGVCTGNCSTVKWLAKTSCQDRFPVLINAGNDPTDLFP
jgi:hypothetical protein